MPIRIVSASLMTHLASKSRTSRDRSHWKNTSRTLRSSSKDTAIDTAHRGGHGQKKSAPQEARLARDVLALQLMPTFGVSDMV